MSAFSSTAFSTSAFSVTAFSFAGIAGDIAASDTITFGDSADLDARGKLEVVGTLSFSGAASLGLIGTISAAGTLSITGVADLDARGALAASSTLAITGLASLVDIGSSNVFAAGSLSIAGVADLDARGVLSAAGTLSITGSADININLPPFWAGGNNRVFRFTVGTGTDTIDFTPYWTDPENDPIVDYQLVVFESLPVGWSLNPVTGIMTITIDTASSHTGWAMSAEDDSGGIGMSAEFSIVVVAVTVVTFRFEMS